MVDGWNLKVMHWWKDNGREREVIWGKLYPYSHFHNKSYMDGLGMEPVPSLLRPVTTSANNQTFLCCRSRWPCGLKRRSAAAWWAGTVGSNPAKGKHFCLLCFLCVVYVAAPATSWSLVQRSPTDVCMWAWVRVCDVLLLTYLLIGAESFLRSYPVFS
jgi:hypothetical protein